MKTVTDAEYHLTFGLHSGIPLCCALHFSEGGKGGPCPKCIEAGTTREELWANLHQCDGNNPNCTPYLQRVQFNILSAFRRKVLHPPKKLVKGFESGRPEKTWGCCTQLPLIEELREALKEEGFRMVHLCWPEPSTYWYIWQQVGGKKGRCGICNTKFSLQFPTSGVVK